MSHPQDSALILLDSIRYGVYFDVKSAFASVSGEHEERSRLLSQPQSATCSLQMHTRFSHPRILRRKEGGVVQEPR
jgi:hypothetical protein